MIKIIDSKSLSIYNFINHHCILSSMFRRQIVYNSTRLRSNEDNNYVVNMIINSQHIILREATFGTGILSKRSSFKWNWVMI